MSKGGDMTRRAQVQALVRVVKYRPLFVAAIIGGGVFAVTLERVGLSFILPIIEIVQLPGDLVANADGIMLAFVTAYQALKIPFTLGYGYDTLFGDDGVRLSGRQKQRVALARSLIEDADLLILDEATSNLDSNLEKQMQRAIEEMKGDYAIVTIAHRLSTMNKADRIYTVQNRRIIERGKCQMLVNQDGKYAELYGIQSS